MVLGQILIYLRPYEYTTAVPCLWYVAQCDRPGLVRDPQLESQVWLSF